MNATPQTHSHKPQDATTMLRADHQHVSELFEHYEHARTGDRKRELIQEICDALTVHAQIEEEIFYPAVKDAMHDSELVPEARVEHATLKDLIGQIEAAKADDEVFEAKVKVLSEYVKHHVKEEQSEMFPKAKKTKLDMKELGARMASRKEELMAERRARH